MSPQFPPRLSKNAQIALVAVLVLTLAYSVVIAGQILLWFLLVGLAAGIYVAWLLVVAVFRMVEAVERLADAMEARDGTLTDSPSDGSAASATDPVAEAGAASEVGSDPDRDD